MVLACVHWGHPLGRSQARGLGHRCMSLWAALSSGPLEQVGDKEDTPGSSECQALAGRCHCCSGPPPGRPPGLRGHGKVVGRPGMEGSTGAHRLVAL